MKLEEFEEVFLKGNKGLSFTEARKLPYNEGDDDSNWSLDREFCDASDACKEMVPKLIKLARAAQAQRQALIQCELEEYILKQFEQAVGEVFDDEARRV